MPNGRNLNMTLESGQGPDIEMTVQTGGNGAAATAEAYAVGTRGGVAVGSDDPAYNNYAKYWAQQAASSATDATKYPKIVNNKWQIWNATSGQYEDTGIYVGWHIAKIYNSISEMNADYSGTDVAVGEYVMIVESVETADNAKVYIKGSSAYEFVVDMSGATGIQGPIGVTPQFSIGTVEALSHGDDPTASVDNTDPKHPVLNLGIPAGASGNETIDDTAGLGDTDLVYSADKVRKELDTKAPVVDVPLTTPASVQSFPDGADGMPMALTVGVEPVQDLHGYDNPWPAGGGKNLCPKATSASYSGIQFTVNDDGSVKIVADGTSSNTRSIDIPVTLTEGKTYTASGITGGSSSTYQVYLQTSDGGATSAGNFTSGSKTWTQNNDNYAVGIFRIRVVSGVVVNTTIYPQIEEGSTATDFAPYSNICLISGWTGAKVTRTGKNLLTDKTYQGGLSYNRDPGTVITLTTYDAVSKNDGVFSLAIPTWQYFSMISEPLKAGDYRCYIPLSCSSSSNLRATVYVIDGNMTITRQLEIIQGNKTFNQVVTIAENEKYIGIGISANTASTIAVTRPQIEIGSVVTDYEPYSGKTLPITFPSQAGTVYGGTLTVNKDGSGELVVDRADVDLGTMTWTASAGAFYSTDLSALIKLPASTSVVGNYICSSLEQIPAGTTLNANQYAVAQNGRLWSKDGSSATAADFKTVMSGVQLVYELATPVTYSLTPGQVKTLLGVNNIFADCGSITEVLYPADTKLYIDKKFAELSAAITALGT